MLLQMEHGLWCLTALEEPMIHIKRQTTKKHVQYLIYPIVWRIATAIFKSLAIVPNVEVAVWVSSALPALKEPPVSSACVIWYQLNHQLYA